MVVVVTWMPTDPGDHTPAPWRQRLLVAIGSSLPHDAFPTMQSTHAMAPWVRLPSGLILRVAQMAVRDLRVGWWWLGGGLGVVASGALLELGH